MINIYTDVSYAARDYVNDHNLGCEEVCVSVKQDEKKAALKS